MFAKLIFRRREVNGGQIIRPEVLDKILTEQFSNMRDSKPMGLGWKIAYGLKSERLTWQDGGAGERIGAVVPRS